METTTQAPISGFTINGKPVSKLKYLLAYNALVVLDFIRPIAKVALVAWTAFSFWQHNQTHALIGSGVIAFFAVLMYFSEPNERVSARDFFRILAVAGFFTALWHHGIVAAGAAVLVFAYIRATDK